MGSFVASFLLVFIAEMGDKSQLLALAFASRYRPSTVLLGVFIATLANHAIAVVIGRFVATRVPLDIVSFAVACSFIYFGIWTAHGDVFTEKPQGKNSFLPILAVAGAFFLIEMGDKTQLATVSLAAKYPNPLIVLFSTSLGMVAADALAIFVGAELKDAVPPLVMKWISAGIFIVYGWYSLYKSLLPNFSASQIALAMWLVVILTLFTLLYYAARKPK